MTSPSQDASARSEQRSKEDASQNKQRKSRRDESSDKSSRSSDSAKGRKESRGMERRRSNKSRSNSREVDKNDGCVLYVNNLGQKCNEEDLRSMFNKAGKVIAATLTREPYNKAPRGFGFVTYDTKDEAKNAVEMFNGTEFNGQKIGVEFAKRKSARDKTPGKYLGRSRRRRSSSDSRSRRRDRDRDYRRRDRDRDYRRRSRDRSRDRRERSRDRRDRDRDYGYRRNRSRDRRDRSRERRSGSEDRYRRRDRS